MAAAAELSRREFLELSGKALASLIIPFGKLDEPSEAKELPPLTEARPGLSMEQAQHLKEASEKYIAREYPKAVEVARRLDFIRNQEIEDPSNICGPLSVAQLRDADLLSEETNIADFWLPNPEPPGNALFERTFPRDRYDWMVADQAVDRIDFKQSPLFSGDLIFLRSGGRGSFGHMLVVTNVGPDGEVYSVTNVNSPNGFIIDEVMLYDPNHPGKGQFYKWTDPKNEKLGLTGFGGFFLWRLRYN